MNNRLMTYLIILGALSLGVLVIMNSFDWTGMEKKAKYLSPNDVNGMEIYAKEVPYTLNFEQQNQVIQILNRSVAVEMKQYLDSDESPFDYEKLVIYRFNKEPLELIPVGLIQQNLMLKVPEWNPSGFIREMGPGELNDLLNQTFDH